MQRTLLFVACGGLLLLWSLASLAGETPLKYPKTKRGDQVDDYHGTKVADPYHWLEADVRESKDVAAWVDQAGAWGDHVPDRLLDCLVADDAEELAPVEREGYVIDRPGFSPIEDVVNRQPADLKHGASLV